MTATHTPRRTVRVGNELWSAFLERHGPKGASARLRHLMINDLEKGQAPGEATPGPVAPTMSKQREGTAE